MLMGFTGVKITRAPWARSPKNGGRAPGRPELGARPAPRNFRYDNRERKEYFSYF